MAIKKTTSPAVVAYDDAKWRAREDMHTLSRAREIEADRRRMAAAQREAAAEMKKLQSVTRKTVRK
jgi:hypothetical protein